MTLTRRLALAMGASLLALATTAQAQDALRVGAYPANPPWQNQNEDGTFEGFEVDIVTEIASRMGRTVEIQPYDFRALFVATASGRADMVISSLTITDERLEAQSFTQPYVEGALGIGTREGAGIDSLDDLNGKVVGAIATSFGETYLKEHEADAGYAELRSYDTVANMLTDLQNGRIEAVVNDEVGLRYAFQQMQGLTVGGAIQTGELFAMMMPKDSPLLEEVNGHISDMKSDGTMARLYESWLGAAPAEGSVTVTPMPVPTSASGN
ncbi:ABC transporter substrate-binding protein [Rubellimicrobium roseum]|uniref:Amino acid ABC transporter substrate-binding protein n=1 Tax=Rubellimicrobium roseum TaxID=687525 RepID=A0A5C4NFA8_9RHOB|nr:ABC transporter substrate-binding protein [Rubellimicrobium roseum]TNC73323.1 amino acid ABC transporter substrate-binding protein [Rubellimicrobium roseum]